MIYADSWVVVLFIDICITIVLYGAFPIIYAVKSDLKADKDRYLKYCIVSGALICIALSVMRYVLYGVIDVRFFAATLWTGIFHRIGSKILDGKEDVDISDFKLDCSEERLLMKRQGKNKNNMKLIFAAIVVGILAVVGFMFVIGYGDDKEYPASIEIADAAEAVLYLEMYDENGELFGSASGFLINDGRTLVTNYHVIEYAYHIKAWSEKDEETDVSTVIAYDEVADLAVLYTDRAIDVMSLPVADSDIVRKGDEIFTAGYPLGIANTLADGIVSSKYYNWNDVEIIQITAAISGGNSGGPLLNADGHVIGVVSSSYTDGQNLNMAISSNTLKDLIETADERVKLNDWKDRPLMPYEIEMYEYYEKENDTEIIEEPVSEEPAPEEVIPSPDIPYGKADTPQKEVQDVPVTMPDEPEPISPVEDVSKKEEDIPLLAVSTNSVTTSDTATITVTSSLLKEQSGVIMVKHFESEVKVVWGIKSGAEIPLTLIPQQKGEFTVKISLRNDPSVFEEIKIISE